MSPQTDWFEQNAPKAPPAGGDWFEANAPKAEADTPEPRTKMDSVGDFASELGKQINPISMAKGMAQLTSHPIDTLKQDASARQEVYKQAEDAFKKGNHTEAAAHLLYSFIPFLGPQINEAANNFMQGNYAKGAGSSVGMGLALAGPDALGEVKLKLPKGADDLARRGYQSALKPSTALSTAQVEGRVATGLENNLPVSPEGVTKLSGLVNELKKSVTAEIASDPTATVNKYKVASRLSDVTDKFGKQMNPEADLNAVAESGNEFLRNQPDEIPAKTAQQLKQGTYKQIKARSYGELKSATIEAEKALARGAKEELEVQFPELKGLNASEGRLIGLQSSLERAVRRVRNHDIFSLGGKIAIGAGGAILGAATGTAEGAGLGMVGGTALHYVLSDPAVQSKLAISLHRASKGSITIPAATARITGYVNALGNAVNSGTPSDNQSEQ